MLRTEASQLRALWAGLGLRRGQTVLCHTFLPSLGRVQPGPETILDTLLEAIGDHGTFVAPTFTYSYFKSEIYDTEESPSTVGLLGDLVRNRSGAVRSLDPNFSMAAIGPAAGTLMRRDTRNCLGPDSTFDKLIRGDTQVLLLGVDFTALPLFMHLEKMHNVDYRYDKRFTGRTRHNGTVFDDESIHYVRDEKRNPESLRSRAGGEIDLDSCCIQRQFGYGTHRFVPAKTVVDVVARGLAKDKFFLIKTPV